MIAHERLGNGFRFNIRGEWISLTVQEAEQIADVVCSHTGGCKFLAQAQDEIRDLLEKWMPKPQQDESTLDKGEADVV